MNMKRFKLAMKIESKVDKLEKMLNRVTTTDERDKFVKLYLTKDDNLMVIIDLICKPHEFDSKAQWISRKDVDYGDELIFTYLRNVWIKPRRILDYINKDVSNKNIYRAYLILSKVLLEDDALTYLHGRVDKMFKNSFESIKQGLDPTRGASLHHVMMLIKILWHVDEDLSVMQLTSGLHVWIHIINCNTYRSYFYWHNLWTTFRCVFY